MGRMETEKITYNKNGQPRKKRVSGVKTLVTVTLDQLVAQLPKSAPIVISTTWAKNVGFTVVENSEIKIEAVKESPAPQEDHDPVDKINVESF